MSDTLFKVQSWYLDQCNGEWEHTHGISITTLDNPGWEVKIDLKDTRWENAHFGDLNVERAENDWIRCAKEAEHFKGYGDPTKLDRILDFFLEQVAKT